MFDITRAVLNNATRRRPNVEISQTTSEPKPSLGEPRFEPAHYYDFSVDNRSHSWRTRRHARAASNPSFIVAPSETKFTVPGPASNDSVAGASAFRARQRKVTFAVNLPSLLRNRSASAQHLSGRVIGRPEKLRRRTGHITLKPKPSERSPNGNYKTQANNCSDEGSDSSPPMCFARYRSSEDSDSSPIRFAHVFSPSISNHVFTATSPSIYPITTHPSIQEHTPMSLVPQLIHKNTGAVFESVSEGNSGIVSVEDTRRLDGEEYVLRYSLPDLHRDDLRQASVPALALTLPTPNIRSSPVFQPQSPFTLSKYITAASSEDVLEEPGSLLRHPIPTPPRCKSCQILNGEGACSRACRQQLLACKVWYAASDSGRRRRLTEPYVRAGECTAGTRGVLGELGLPVGSPRGLGLDLPPGGQDAGVGVEAATPTDTAGASHDGQAAVPGITTASSAREPAEQAPADVRVLQASGPSRLWSGLKKVVRARSPSDAARLVQAMVGRVRSQSMVEVVVRTSSMQEIR